MSGATAPQLAPPPSRPGHPLWGVYPEYRRDPLAFFRRVATEQGDVARLRFGPYANYVISHPDHIRHVLQTRHGNYPFSAFGRGVIRTVLGQNILSTNDDAWRWRRRLMNPVFHRHQVGGLGDVMVRAACDLLERWSEAAPGGRVVEIHEAMLHVGMQIVLEAFFHIDDERAVDELTADLTVLMDYVDYLWSGFMPVPLAIPTQRNRRLLQARARARRTMQAAIDARRRSGDTGDDLLGALLAYRHEGTGEGLTDEEIASEMLAITGAGLATTATTLSWTWYLLALHPEVERTLRAELTTTLGSRLPTVDDLASLPYLSMVIQETTRLYPPFWAFMSRDSTEDDEIGGYRIPAGATVSIVPYVVQRDPRFWDEPEQFRPERFTPEASAGRHKFAHLPFGAGPRKCIGHGFAMIEAPLVVATILLRATLRLKPGHRVTARPAYVLLPGGGVPMEVSVAPGSLTARRSDPACAGTPPACAPYRA